MISVVIPAYNAAETIGKQLEALAGQTFRGEWEVIVADNGSTDTTAEVAQSYQSRLPALHVVDASERRGPTAARNIGASSAHGDQLAFCDADDVVSSEWLENMAAALNEHQFVAGAMDHDTLNRGTSNAWHWRSHETSAPLGMRFLPYALSSNMGVSKSAFEEAGGFPEEVTVAAGDDVALSWLLQMEGHPLHFEKSAVVAYRHRESLRDLWRQQTAYASQEPWLYRRFRSAGVPRPPQLAALRGLVLLVLRLHWLFGRDTRAHWLRMLARRWGRLRGSIRHRVLYL